MPGAVSRTSTYALTNVTLPYAVQIADKRHRGGRAGGHRDPARGQRDRRQARLSRGGGGVRTAMRHVLTGTAWRARAVALLLTVCVAAAAFGWGDETHRAVSRGAAVILPDETPPVLPGQQRFHRAAQHGPGLHPQPDRRRSGPSISSTLTRTASRRSRTCRMTAPSWRRNSARRRSSSAACCPGRCNREFDRLVKAFRERDWAETRLAAAYLSHFVADATMPLHATRNYDGQLTGNNGIHRRIEVEMVARYHNVSMIAPSGITAIGDPVEWAFPGTRAQPELLSGVPESRHRGAAGGASGQRSLLSQAERRRGRQSWTRARATRRTRSPASGWPHGRRPAGPPCRRSARSWCS